MGRDRGRDKCGCRCVDVPRQSSHCDLRLSASPVACQRTLPAVLGHGGTCTVRRVATRPTDNSATILRPSPTMATVGTNNSFTLCRVQASRETPRGRLGVAHEASVQARRLQRYSGTHQWGGENLYVEQATPAKQ